EAERLDVLFQLLRPRLAEDDHDEGDQDERAAPERSLLLHGIVIRHGRISSSVITSLRSWTISTISIPQKPSDIGVIVRTTGRLVLHSEFGRDPDDAEKTKETDEDVKDSKSQRPRRLKCRH